MVASMTGFGKASGEIQNKKITIEIKSLNSKNLDLNVRIPSLYKEKELEIRKFISKNLTRGKVDFSLQMETTEKETATTINKEIVAGYMEQLSEINPNGSNTEHLTTAMRLPDVLKTTTEELDEDSWKEILDIIQNAIDKLLEFRISEGKSIEEDFNLRIQNISTLLEQVKTVEQERVEQIKKKLRNSLEELKTKVDENRFEQEMIYYLEKLDITEEKVRLKKHLEYFIETLNQPESSGKKLGFITQEIGREINTLGSKSNHSGMQKIVVQMKDELEKMKEQVLNTL